MEWCKSSPSVGSLAVSTSSSVSSLLVEEWSAKNASPAKKLTSASEPHGEPYDATCTGVPFIYPRHADLYLGTPRYKSRHAMTSRLDTLVTRSLSRDILF